MFSACSLRAANKAGERAITKLHAISPTSGYKLSEVMVLGGPAPFPKVGKSFNLTRSSTNPVADECKKINAYAKRLGVASLSDDFPTKIFAKNQLQFVCVNSLNSVGTEIGVSTSFNLYGIYQDGKDKFQLVVSLNRETKLPVKAGSKYRYNGTVSLYFKQTEIDPNTSKDQPVDGNLSVLNAIGQYRFTHPNSDPYSSANVGSALRDFSKSNKEISIKQIPDSGGQITHLELVATDSPKGEQSFPYCMSIRKFDPKHFGTPDPGKYVAVGYVWALSRESHFGEIATGTCPKW
ncbi:MAG: hypothetical protein EBQ72_02385 [Actinobacteria bacterium]|nr:hypothetical protein [Actinomycetota bacterium]